jgi:hypothetical protein
MTRLPQHRVFSRHFLSISVVLLFLALAPVLLVSTSHAQVNGTPASVTSPGFSGNAVNGPRASVTSVGPQGYAAHSHATFSTSSPNDHRNGDHHRDGDHDRRRRNDDGSAGVGFYAVPVPYAVDNAAPAEEDVDADANENDPDDQGGPTVMDRRGSGARSYAPPTRDAFRPSSAHHSEVAPAEPEAPLAPTLLIFKDGHKLEVGNYAILNTTLFDLTPGHPRKIALAELDLDATRKQNDDRGVIFKLPAGAKTN